MTKKHITTQLVGRNGFTEDDFYRAVKGGFSLPASAALRFARQQKQGPPQAMPPASPAPARRRGRPKAKPC